MSTKNRKPISADDLSGELYEMHDVVASTGRTRQCIYNWLARGTFPAPRFIGRSVLWPAEVVEEWVADHPERLGRHLRQSLAARGAE